MINVVTQLSCRILLIRVMWHLRVVATCSCLCVQYKQKKLCLAVAAAKPFWNWVTPTFPAYLASFDFMLKKNIRFLSLCSLPHLKQAFRMVHADCP